MGHYDNTNLLTETLEVLDRNHKTPDDILWIGICDGDCFGTFNKTCTWDDFAGMAKDIVYYSGYGGRVISELLFIVGNNWWLERGEYDGSEWWNFKTSPVKPEQSRLMLPEDITNVNDLSG